jgi:nucleoid-associated protein YgaU
VPALNSAIAVPMPRAAAPSPAANNPLVESYDEDTHVCRANETLRTISQTYYQSDRYERALLLFNRNHPLATESIRQDPPQLAPGQKVYVPPARILEKYYASALAEAMPVQPEAAPVQRGQEPSGSIRPTVTAPVPTPAPNRAAAPVAEKTYRVAANGEMMREIARRTLGDADRWAEIYQLNLRYDPKEPVPAGTELRLPSNARPDTATAP